MSIVATILHAAAAMSGAATELTTPPPLPTTSPAAGPTTLPIGGATATQSLLVATALLAFGLIGAAFARVFRPRSVEGPIRVTAQLSPLPILIVTLIGGGVWLGSQVFYGAAKAAQFQQAHPGAHFSMDELSDSDFAFLSTVPAGVGLVILLASDFAVKLPGRIGYSLVRIPRGITRGVIAAIISLPIVWAFTALLTLFYEATNIQHPSEHELLKVMKESAPHLRWVMVIGACVAAPLFEEMLFRGHIQTLIVRLLMPLPPAIPPIPEARYVDMGFNPLPLPPLESTTLIPSPDPSPTPPRAPRWIAIVATSLLFAIVHPLWMAPAIFVLAICLGYAYERTGNLWVPILIHAAFNTASTLVVLGPS